jgi:hypothetical protein
MLYEKAPGVTGWERALFSADAAAGITLLEKLLKIEALHAAGCEAATLSQQEGAAADLPASSRLGGASAERLPSSR